MSESDAPFDCKRSARLVLRSAIRAFLTAISTRGVRCPDCGGFASPAYLLRWQRSKGSLTAITKGIKSIAQQRAEDELWFAPSTIRAQKTRTLPEFPAPKGDAGLNWLAASSIMQAKLVLIRSYRDMLWCGSTFFLLMKYINLRRCLVTKGTLILPKDVQYLAPYSSLLTINSTSSPAKPQTPLTPATPPPAPTPDITSLPACLRI